MKIIIRENEIENLLLEHVRKTISSEVNVKSLKFGYIDENYGIGFSIEVN